MPNRSIPPPLLWLLDEGFLGYLGTSSRRGIPSVSPVIFVHDRGSLFIITSKVARKYRNMKENRQVAFLIDVRDPSDIHNNRAILIYGKAKIYQVPHILRELPRMRRIRALFKSKYPKFTQKYEREEHHLPRAWRTTLFFSRMLIRIDIERFAYIREAKAIPIPESLR